MRRETIIDDSYTNRASYKAAVAVLHDVNADNTLKEQIRYTDDTFPVGVWTDIYKYFIDNTLSCHWHHDFEFGIMLEGSVDYTINDTHMRLDKGDAFFVNSNILHMGRQAETGKNAVMYTLTFPVALLSSNINSTVYTKYINPMLSKRIEGFQISEINPYGRDVKALLMDIYDLEPSSFGYELECLALVNRLWHTMLRYIESGKADLLYRTGDMRHTERMKEILSYIHEHYNEKIAAEDIAKHVNISRGECFRCFKHFMGKPLVEYVNEYRLQRAAKLLRETEKNVTEISLECGFENASYFGKIFKNAYAMTPFQYKKAQIWTDNTVRVINGYDYEYWKDSGNGTMVITSNANNGSFLCEWNNADDILFRSGMKFRDSSKTHGQMGAISLQYAAAYHSCGSSYLCVYGWTVDPLIEWYIIERHTSYTSILEIPRLGVLNTDDGVYELFRVTRENKPSILGIRTFEQYWSIRTSERSGGKVDVSAHFRAWEGLGLPMGKIAEISLSVEGWHSSGNAAVHTNILTIGGQA